MGTVVDFHSHVLPDLDDGSESLEQSIAMLKMEKAQGIDHVIATPHFYARQDKPETFLKKRAMAEQALRQEMARHPDMPRLSMGAEVYYFGGIGDSEMLRQMTVAGTGYVLIEMPMPPWKERVYRDLESIYYKQNLVPIIAHIDRYIAPLHTYHIPKRLEKLPVMVQANASFFLEKSTRNMALRMLGQGKIQLLGSDCHNLTDRAPNLASALEVIRKKFGDDVISYINAQEKEVLE